MDRKRQYRIRRRYKKTLQEIERDVKDTINCRQELDAGSGIDHYEDESSEHLDEGPEAQGQVSTDVDEDIYMAIEIGANEEIQTESDNDWLEDILISEASDSDTEHAIPENEYIGHGASQPAMKDDLQQWAIDHNIKHTALNSLLKIIKSHYAEEKLPDDARTLLQTPRNITLLPMGEGSFHYFGFEDGLVLAISQFKAMKRDELSSEMKLDINIDGLPVGKSSNFQFWPILCSIYSLNSTPFPIAIFLGKSKPPLQEYFKDFIRDLNRITTDGITVHDKKYTFSLRALLCDAPARAYVKQIKGHGGYYACEKCVTKGIYKNSSMSYPVVTDTLRTYPEFVGQQQPEHHIGVSPLVDTGIDLISQVPLDYMHLVLLGVQRRLLTMWRSKIPYKLNAQQKVLLSQKLTELRTWIPTEFVRKPRALEEVDRWKATELRLFLLYIGPIVLRGILPTKQYKHFMLLFYSIRILCTERLLVNELYFEFARECLVRFVEVYSQVYTNENVVYNVHSLVHLADEASRFGVLDSISCFKFESYLGSIKRKLRSGNSPLAQVCLRIYEQRAKSVPIRKTRHNTLSLANGEVQCTQANLTQNVFALANGPLLRNSCVELSDGSNAIITRIEDGRVFLKKLDNGSDAFKTPSPSRDIHISKFSKVGSNDIAVSTTQMKYKCMVLPLKNEGSVVVMPLMHSA